MELKPGLDVVSGDGSHAPRGPEVRAELTLVVPVSLRVRSGTRGGVFEPVEAPLTVLQQGSRGFVNMRI